MSDVFVTTYAEAPQLDGTLMGRLGVFHGALTLGSSLLVLPDGDARWADDQLHFRGTTYALGDTFVAAGGQSSLKRLRTTPTPPGWPDNGGVALVARSPG